MRAPFCSESSDLCPEDRDIIRFENDNKNEIQQNLERNRVCKAAVFGIRLDDLMGTSFQIVPQIPFIISRICSFIEKHGMHERCLFCSSDETNVVQNLKVEFSENGDASLESAGNIAPIAKLLIVFLEELPEPLIPPSAQNDLIKDMKKLSLNPVEGFSSLKSSLEKLPDSTYQVLKYLSRFLLRVTFHEKDNGMNSVNLAIIFGPVIFRPSLNDQHAIIAFRNLTNCFVKDYHAIFENRKDFEVSQYPPSIKIIRQPCPSSVVPITTSLSPLSVVIPPEDGNVEAEKNVSIPILLIEGHPNAQLQVSINEASDSSRTKKDLGTSPVAITRKRKERRFSGEDSQQRSSSEERPSALIAVTTADVMRRCNSHEEMVGYGENSKEKQNNKTDLQLSSSYVPNSLDLIISETNLSPHPPTAKRREIEINEVDCWHPTQLDRNISIPSSTFNHIKQNSVAESPKSSTMDCSDDVGEAEEEISISRSSSCPIPQSNNRPAENHSERDSLSLSWSMLFEDDSEPVRSDPHLNLSKGDEETLLSPSVQSLRQSEYYEAPLSPSAFRSYLSYRSTHLDPSVPPSPPVEQEDFAKKLGESSSSSDSMKQLTKKIHSIKKRIRRYDEKFESEFGFKPSHAEKSNNHDVKKLLNDLYKARKDLKGLKEESHLEHVGNTWRASQAHILEDTTNQLTHEINNKGKQKSSAAEDFFDETMKSLADDRKSANRPESFDDMSKDQIKEEKLAIQKALLNYEKVHGKPITRERREACRPLYERYRNVKRILVRSGTFPGSTSKSKDLCSELQPILEHETMDFPARQLTAKPETSNAVIETEMPDQDLKVEDCDHVITKEQNSSSFLAMKYDNSNLHELPLSEMLFQMQNIKSEKRRLRKILKEFETEFIKLNKRKVQKEDKVTMESFYNEYKHIKARLKLLEALISKHDQHQLM